MKILEKFKEALNWDELDEDSAKEIIATLDSELEEIKKAEEDKEKQTEYDKNMEWANKVVEARKKDSKSAKTRASLRHQANISPARLVRLRKQGKI